MEEELYFDHLCLFRKLIACLKVLPITPKVLKETKIGKGVNSIVKDGVFKQEDVDAFALKLVN